MKKNYLTGFPCGRIKRKWGRIMRLTLFLMVGFILSASANSYSQTTRLNIELKNQAIIDVIEYVEENSEFVFLYKNEDLNLNRKVTINLKDATIDKILDAAFIEQSIDYDVYERQIVLRKAESTLSAAQSAQQQRTVAGVVTDQSGQPLPGVTVMVPGTTTGTVTNDDGEFSVTIPDDAEILQFSFVGMRMQEVPIDGRTTVTVVMEEEAIGIEEVVAIGYGTARRMDITGSAATVNTSSLTEMPTFRVDQLLQGKASGMLVTMVNGNPGASSSIRIRGNSSITASSEPLYVVDGILGGGDLSTINPSDIESITILKDASTTAIYGSQGANGVILITTKRGKIGPAQINVNVQQGTQWLPRKLELLSGAEYAQLLNESRIAAGAQPIYDNPDAIETTDWQDEIMQTAPLTNVNVTYNGGNENINYFISGNYYNQQGIIKNSGVERLQFRTNIEGRFNDKIKLGINLNAGRINTDNNTVSLTPQWSLLTTAPSMPVFNSDGTYNSNYPHPHFNGPFNTPVAEQNLRTSESYRGNLMVNAYIEYSPLEWLTLKSTFGGQMLGISGNFNYTSSELPGQSLNQQFGTAGISYNNYTNFQNENTASFIKQFDNNHFIEGVIGATFQGGISESVNASAQRFFVDGNLWYNLAAGDPVTRNIGSGYQNWAMNSYLGRFTYKFRDRYIITAVGREDGSSRLGEGNKWHFFPSLAIGWIATEEIFLNDLNDLSFLKLKASYGIVGNQAVGIYQTLSNLTAYPTIVGNQRVSGWLPGDVSGNTSLKGNPDLTWEVKEQLDIGLEVNFFNDRLGFIADYYKAITDNLLLLTEIPSQTGFTQQMDNIGKVSNTGIELKINSVNIQNSDFNWTTDLALAFNKNEVLELGETDADIVTHTYTWGVQPIGILRIGEPVGSFFGYETNGIWKENQGEGSIQPGAQAGTNRYMDQNNDGIVNEEDKVILGNGSPDWYGGIGNTFSYKGIGLNIFFSGALGAKIFNGNAPFLRSTDAQYNHYREVLDRWHPVNNPDSDVPGALNLERETAPSDRWVFDASYIRLESINFSYNIPLSDNMKNYIKNATISLSGLNLFVLSPYNAWGYDPVIHVPGGSDLGYRNALRGFDYGAYPKNASFTLGVNVIF